MKQISILLLLGVSLVSFGQKKIKVLFIGNSYTYVNNLPQAVADMATGKGDTVIFDSHTVGGYSFQQHSADATTQQKIAQGGWDYVVIQGQSQEPSFPPAQVQQQTYPYARILDSLVHAADSCTETIFYMTWGKENGDSANCASYPVICTYSGDQDRLSQSYQEMGQLNHATVAPAGEAWRLVKAQNTGFPLYQTDHSHPTIWGTYLVASVMYEILFQKSVMADTFITSGISTTDALLLRQAAHTTVSDSLSKWLSSGNIPVASFTKAVTGSTVSFTSTSINGVQFDWNYGDNHQGNGASVSHSYTASGTYGVTLKVTDHCKVSYYTDSVTVHVNTGIRNIANDNIKIYPNPAQAFIYIDIEEPETANEFPIRITNSMGQCVKTLLVYSKHITIPTTDLPTGKYIVEVITPQAVSKHRILVAH